MLLVKVFPELLVAQRERRTSSGESGWRFEESRCGKTSVGWESRESGWEFEESALWFDESGLAFEDSALWFDERGPAFEESGDADMPSRWEDDECRSTFEPSVSSNMHSGDHFRSGASWFGSSRNACVHCVGWFGK
jgi:hypothetical protein